MKIVKKYKYNILAFLIPIIIFSMILLIKGCFTKNVFFASDMNDQYFPLFSYLKDVVTGKQSIFYSFSKGLGGSMIGTFAYYLSSPLNLITCIFPKSMLNITMLIVVLVKIGLSGFTMSIYLKDKLKNNQVFLLMFSICYALMSYSLNYYFNIMWLDGVYLTPLVVLGLEKLIDGKSKKLYIIALLLTLLTNYYIGFMICIFNCIYFIYYLIVNNHKLDKKYVLRCLIDFVVSSVISFLIACILLIPTFIDLQSSSKSVSSFFNVGFSFNFNIFDILSKGFLSSSGEKFILNKSTFNWYCGIIVSVLTILFFINKKISKKEKITSLIVILVFLFSFMSLHINMIWHAFNNPIGFNFRYSFLFSFFLILLASKCISNFDKVSLKNSLVITILFLIITYIIILMNYKYLSLGMIYGTVAFFVIYLLFIINYNNQNKISKKSLTIMLLLLTCSELFFQHFFIFRTYSYISVDEYKDYFTSEKYDDKYHRSDGSNRSVLNDSFVLNDKKVTTFLSTNNDNTIVNLANLGVSTNDNIIYYNDGTTKLLNSILSVKYLYSRNVNLNYYKKIGSFKYSPFRGLLYGMLEQKGNIYENDSVLNLGFMTNGEILNYNNKINNKSVFERQNRLLSKMTNSKNTYFKMYEINPMFINKMNVILNNSDSIYIYIPIEYKNDDSEVDVYINNERIKTLTFNDSGIFEISNKYKNEKITLTYEVTGNVEILSYPVLYYFDYEAFDEDIAKLKEHQLNITEMTNTKIEGTINSTNEYNVLFTSIPYEKGWTLKVDGKKTNIIKLCSGFVGAKLESGNHKIELSYHTPGLFIGLVISMIGIISSILYLKKGEKFTKWLVDLYIKYEEIILYLIVGATTMVISILSYAIFVKLLNINYQISNVLSWILAVVAAYILNKLIVFKSKTKNIKELANEIYQFVKYRVISLIGDMGLMYLFVSIINMNDIIAKIIVQVGVVVANYIFSKLFIFKNKK